MIHMKLSSHQMEYVEEMLTFLQDNPPNEGQGFYHKVSEEDLSLLRRIKDTKTISFEPGEHRRSLIRSLSNMSRYAQRCKNAGSYLPTQFGFIAEKLETYLPINETDLRSITRRSDRCKTTVNLVYRGDHTPWLVFGEAHMNLEHTPARLQSYLPVGVTDYEHDSGWALSLPLIGVTFKHVWYHMVVIQAYVAPHRSNEFNVPNPGYNPVELAEKCPTCTGKDAHLMVPEEYYLPKANLELYKVVSGREVEIRISTLSEEDEEGEDGV